MSTFAAGRTSAAERQKEPRAEPTVSDGGSAALVTPAGTQNCRGVVTNAILPVPSGRRGGREESV